MYKSCVHQDVAFVSDHDSAEIVKPADRSLDLPPARVSSELSTILSLRLFPITSMWADKLYAMLLESIAKLVAVCSSIVNQTFRLFVRQDDFIDRLLYKRDLMWRGRVGKNSERNTLAICHHHKLCSLATLGFADLSSPFFAGKNVPAAKHSSHRRRPFWSSVLSNPRHASFRESSSSHWQRRLQTVLADGKCLGRSFQRAPLRAIQRTASKHARLSAGFCPPLPDTAYSERCGSISAHCSSVTSSPMLYSRLSMSSPPTAYG